VQNAVKHGKAKNIFINLREQAGTLVLSVEDDGVGFSTNPEKSVGAGLYNIRTRAEMIGATLAIGAAPHGGSVLSVSLPAKVT
jgi:two-component system sensor histidine kinase NreB